MQRRWWRFTNDIVSLNRQQEMKLYKNDYSTISAADRIVWEDLRAKEIVYRDGKPTSLRKSLYSDYPKSVRHFISLFPNNFIDAADLTKSSKQLNTTLTQFETLLNNTATTERDLLNFIRVNEAYFIIGSLLKNNYTFGHHGLYVFPEFKMPPNYQSDYLLVGKNSDGYHFVFVELENPYGDITLQDGSYGSTLRKGLKQIEDWEIWIEQNFSNLKLVFEGLQNKNDVLPKEFRDFDKTRVHFVVVAGRRKDYSERTYRQRRNNLEQRKLLVLHYDNLIDYTKATIGTSTY